MGTLKHCGNPGDEGRKTCLGNCVLHPRPVDNDALRCTVGGPASVVGRLQQSLAEEVVRADQNFASYERMKQRVGELERIIAISGLPTSGHEAGNAGCVCAVCSYRKYRRTLGG